MICLILFLSGIFFQTSFSIFIKEIKNIKLWKAILLSFKISIVVILINVFIGVPLSYILSFKKNRFSFLLDVVSSLPLTLSPLIIGFAVLITAGPLNPIGKFFINHGIKFVFTPLGIIVVQVIISFPFFVNILKESFDSINRKMLNLSKTLGASSFDILFKIILPVSFNALLAGISMSWSRSMGEFAATQMVSGVIPNITETAPISIFIKASYGNYPYAIAISSILIVVSFISLGFFKFFSYKSKQN
ncbi:MAG: ABC transporter permease subunit [Candidatus Omnitrophica bacterium]|nr:ABC transporter permease subunit [Candidatus Omnitrophota bacterium]